MDPHTLRGYRPTTQGGLDKLSDAHPERHLPKAYRALFPGKDCTDGFTYPQEGTAWRFYWAAF